MAKTQMMLARGDAAATEQARQFIEQYLKKFGDDTDVRIAYARLLVGAKSLLSAREEFRRAAAARPNDGELVYAVALISLQIEDWDSAIAGFSKTLTMDPRDKNPIYFNIGLAYEGKKEPDVASEWYGRITEGDYFVNAQLKIAKQLTKRDGLAAGRKSLASAQSAEYESPETKTQLVLAEAQLLRDGGNFKDAYQVLTDALAKQPESVALRYDRAMIADRLNMLDEMERDLRTVISVKPDHAHAYNALGYTFAERGIRLQEALELINKAVSLAPDDAFILDSLGWVQFRLNQIDDALATLTRAYSMRADPEIAAHLGEVLWAKGNRSEAERVWQRALMESPDNAALLAAVQRLK
jgi:tetratricopeptide (TPR) repeat protein